MMTWMTHAPNAPALPGPVSAPAVSLQEGWTEGPLDAAATAFAAAAVAAAIAAAVAAGEPARRGPVLWVQDRASRRSDGRIHEPGLRRAFRMDVPILHVRVGHPRDALRAMEEGACCAALSAVVGEVDGDAPALDLTATKRLALRARESGVPVWLLRSGKGGGLSAARMRWRLVSRPSEAHPFDPGAPGTAAWTADLVRAAGRSPGLWDLVHDPGAPDRLRVVPRPGDGSLAAQGGPAALAG